MVIKFTLSMPNVGSWNNRWSGEGKEYSRCRTFRTKADIEKYSKLDGKTYYHNFGDGWSAAVDCKIISSAEATRSRKNSAGFYGYDWMIDCILANSYDAKYGTSLALIKFKTTGNIYCCCYQNTSDALFPFIFTKEECTENGVFNPCNYGWKLYDQRIKTDYSFPDECSDLDEVEIYTTYADGFSWIGTGSESHRQIMGPLMPFDNIIADEDDIKKHKE